MNRRDLLKLIAAATGTAMVGANAYAWDSRPPVLLDSTGFTDDDVTFLNDMAEVIIPRTDSPGARDADVGSIMAVIVADCYTQAERAAFKDGMQELKARSEREYGKDFMLLSAEDKMALLSTLDSEAREHNAMLGIGNVVNAKPSSRPTASEAPVPHYFSLFKQLTLFGFFTSQEGAMKALRYISIPGKYVGDLPYKKGDKAWAT